MTGEGSGERRRTERRQHYLPPGVRVRYALAILISLIASYGAYSALGTASDSSQQARQAAQLARGLKAESRATAQLALRLAADERTTCAIQAQGLPAGHQLAASMRAIHTLLTLPRPHSSPAVPARDRLALQALDGHLRAYLRAESREPRQRTC